ncbi:hypothetical protein J0S82_000383 [Galemys pyrenaicus]|uniref:Uncharacterized protein n=1 Tax=Galemys pyrenaicus TaxID=202257 RepID=A0A8J6DG01_GALPY|nr:hypothetical protein J0S82_000383 [Galemys pyrenaicus]
MRWSLVIMGSTKKSQIVLKLPLIDKSNTPKNYDCPEVLRRTFETLSSLHKLLPNRLLEKLHSYRTEEDKKKCACLEGAWAAWEPGEDPELSGLERILKRHEYPKEINLTPKPSSMPLWQRNVLNSAPRGLKCPRSSPEIPMSTVVVRWLKKNMQPAEDLASATQKLSLFGPIQSVALCGRQSAVVVFADVASACRAVSAFTDRAPGTSLQCSWKQPFMAREVRLPTRAPQAGRPAPGRGRSTVEMLSRERHGEPL